MDFDDESRIIDILYLGRNLGLLVPEEDAKKLHTAGEVKEYFKRRLQAVEGKCPSQAAFYRLRGAITAVLPSLRYRLSPSLSWKLILAGRRRATVLARIESRLGEPVPHWSLKGELGHSALGLSGTAPAWDPEGVRRSPTLVAEIVDRILAEILGTTEFTDDSRLLDLERARGRTHDPITESLVALQLAAFAFGGVCLLILVGELLGQWPLEPTFL